MSDETRTDRPFGLSTGALGGDDLVEGHIYKPGRLVEDEETDGHAIRIKGIVDGDAETEGHMPFRKSLTDEDGDDGTEGHGTRVKI